MIMSCQPSGYSCASRWRAFGTEPAGQVTVDGPPVERQHLELHPVRAQFAERPAQYQAGYLPPQPPAAQAGHEQPHRVVGRMLIGVHPQPGIADAATRVLHRPAVLPGRAGGCGSRSAPPGCARGGRPTPAARTSRSRPLLPGRWDNAAGHRRPSPGTRAAAPAARAALAGPAGPAGPAWAGPRPRPAPGRPAAARAPGDARCCTVPDSTMPAAAPALPGPAAPGS